MNSISTHAKYASLFLVRPKHITIRKVDMGANYERKKMFLGNYQCTPNVYTN